MKIRLQSIIYQYRIKLLGQSSLFYGNSRNEAACTGVECLSRALPDAMDDNRRFYPKIFFFAIFFVELLMTDKHCFFFLICELYDVGYF